MSELDYAFLADFAQVEGGKLSVLGGSFTHAELRNEGNAWLMAVAGRVRSHVDSPPTELKITVTAPENSYQLSHTVELEAGSEPRPYADGKVGILFASNFMVPIAINGLFTVQVFLDGQLARTLAFDMSVGS